MGAAGLAVDVPPIAAASIVTQSACFCFSFRADVSFAIFFATSAMSTLSAGNSESGAGHRMLTGIRKEKLHQLQRQLRVACPIARNPGIGLQLWLQMFSARRGIISTRARGIYR